MFPIRKKISYQSFIAVFIYIRNSHRRTLLLWLLLLVGVSGLESIPVETKVSIHVLFNSKSIKFNEVLCVCVCVSAGGTECLCNVFASGVSFPRFSSLTSHLSFSLRALQGTPPDSRLVFKMRSVVNISGFWKFCHFHLRLFTFRCQFNAIQQL